MDKKALLRAIVDTYEDIQKERIRAENRLRSIVKGMDENDPLRIEILKRLTQFKELEGAIEKDALNALKGIPVYRAFSTLSKIFPSTPSKNPSKNKPQKKVKQKMRQRKKVERNIRRESP